MVRRGHEVRLICSEGNDEAEQRATEAGLRVEAVPMNRTGMNPVTDQFYRRRLTERFRDLEPDLLFSYQAKAAVYSSLAAAKLGGCTRHVLFPGLGFLFDEGQSLKRSALRWAAVQLYRRSFRNIETAFFQNEEDAALLNEHRVLSDSVNQLVVNGSGVPLDRFTFAPPVVEPVSFLMATRLLRAKGVVEFAQAARELRSRHGDTVEFHLVGPADTNPSAIHQDELARWVSEGILDYHGAVTDVRPFLERASVFVLPSYYMEGTPRSILEAMAMGRPIITTDSRGCRNTVDPGRNGFLVQPRSVASLVDAMTRFVEHPQQIATMGQASRAIAEERYDVEDVVRTMLGAMGL